MPTKQDLGILRVSLILSDEYPCPFCIGVPPWIEHDFRS